MKTRDELAEAILLASVATDPTTERTRMVSPEAAYWQADAFVAERERRAEVVPTDSAPVAAPAPEAKPRTGTQVSYDGEHWIDLPAGLHSGVYAYSRSYVVIDPDPSSIAPEAKKPHDPDAGCAGCEHVRMTARGVPHGCTATGAFTVLSLAVSRGGPAESWCPKRAPAETAALKFSDSGLLLDANGEVADEDNDGYSAMAYGYAAAVTIRATDRAQSERKVAAMLKVGRETK